MCTPILSALIDERRERGEWVIDDLRQPFDLDDVIAKSYERVLVRSHLRRQIEKRARLKARRRPRRVGLP